MQNQSKFS